LEVGYDIPAKPGMSESEIQTPALLIDLDVFERNLDRMSRFATSRGVRVRVHGKMHKSVAVARRQIEIGGACGICCQKVSEAEAFVRGGIRDVLVTNQIRDPLKINRLVLLPRLGARIIVCVDDLANVKELSQAAQLADTQVECLVEIDCGAGRCGVTSPEAVLDIAIAIKSAPHLKFSGIQAYQGPMQHLVEFAERAKAFEQVLTQVNAVLALLKTHHLHCDIVGGAGTGSYAFEANSGVFNELQCGSYAFMDAAYGRIRDQSGKNWSESEWEHALFLLTSVMSHVKPDVAICDAGLKSQSVDSGLPMVYGLPDIEYLKCSDEHGVLADPNRVLQANDRLRLIPGHCDPTCNLHDWYVGVRNGIVEELWPIEARGKSL
jgi:3-hydroxy-D-aspartate aldolase